MALRHETVVESLQQLGLSQYEARVYLGLLTHGPQNGNEVSRTSGVPSSKVYAMLERLAEDGIVARTRRGNSVEYVCVPPGDLLHKLREQYIPALDYLEDTLPQLASAHPEPEILQVQGLEAIIDNAQAIIRGAKSEIFLSLWEEKVEPLRQALEDANTRKVRIAGMLYGTESIGVGWWQQHSYTETVGSRIRGTMLTVVADAAETIIAHMPENGEPSAVRTRNPVLCLVAEEYLIHDLTLQKAKTMTGYEEWDRWLRSDDEVRALTLGRTGHLSPIEPPATRKTRP